MKDNFDRRWISVEKEYIIEMLGISKSFAGVIANDNIDFMLKKGEVHGLLGENGAGKSTLMKILSGAYKAQEGVIKKNGKEIRIEDSRDALEHGIGMVHQSLRLIDSFTVLDNIILGNEKSRAGFSERKRARETLRLLCEKYHLNIDTDKKVKEISHSMRVCTEIMKLLYSDCEILIFDEPTAVLTRDATDSFIKAVRMLADEGRSIVFITHKLNEIMMAADRISVLRKGRYVGTVKSNQTDAKELSYMMMGKVEVSPVIKKITDNSSIILEAKNLFVKRYVKKENKGISFQIKSGEIVALTGVEGNGQSDVIKMLTGEKRVKKGRIYLLSKDITECSTGERRRSGISYIPEDREGRGLIFDFSLPYNMVLPRLRDRIFQKNGFIRKKVVKEYAEKIIRDFDINLKVDTEMPVRYLSAGNQQKALLGRELEQNKTFIIAEEPFRGLDAYSAESIYLKFIEKRNEGKGILFVSYDADEIMKLSDRILVIYEGEITGELYPEKITVSELGMYISGAARQQESENYEQS